MEMGSFEFLTGAETEPIVHLIILEFIRPTNDGRQLGSVACIVECLIKSDHWSQSRDRVRDRCRPT